MVNNLYNFYHDYYQLKKINLNISNKNIIFLIYDEKYNYYLDNNSFISKNNLKDILATISEFNEKYKLDIINYYPLCFCNKTLVICLKTKQITSPHLNIINYKDIDKSLNSLINYHRSKDLTLYISQNIKEEIYSSQRYLYRYKIHEKIIKKYFLTKARRKKDEFNKILQELIPSKESIIDISCGDSNDMISVAKQKKYKTIVGNDICINYLYRNKDDKVIYTNDNIEQNFVGSSVYDVSFCKNTLHHMNDIVCINNLLSFMEKISDEMIIVEIIDPKETGGLPLFLNKYLYSKFLRDAGKCFLNEEQLINVIDNKFSNYNIEYRKFKNILGEHLIAKITKK